MMTGMKSFHFQRSPFLGCESVAQPSMFTGLLWLSQVRRSN